MSTSTTALHILQLWTQFIGTVGCQVKCNAACPLVFVLYTGVSMGRRREVDIEYPVCPASFVWSKMPMGTMQIQQNSKLTKLRLGRSAEMEPGAMFICMRGSLLALGDHGRETCGSYPCGSMARSPCIDRPEITEPLNSLPKRGIGSDEDHQRETMARCCLDAEAEW